MPFYGPEAIVHAAEEAEDKCNWRRAFGFWQDAISQYGSSVSSDELEYWKRHRDMCDKKMRE